MFSFTLIIYYILIFTIVLLIVISNLEFKGIITFLKIISLMEHKACKINILGHS